MIDRSAIVGFEWDAGNARKNGKHAVSMAEAEQVFFHAPLLMLDVPYQSLIKVWLQEKLHSH